MSELDYRIEHFDHNFSSVRGKRIFLYGAGKNTEAVIRHFDDIYDFNAIIVPETDAAEGSGKNRLWGKPVCTLEEALAQDPDIILIAAQMFSAEMIYQRINQDCRRKGVVLMDLYGHDQIQLHDEIDAQRYQDLQGWEELTEEYDIVSFALLDTILVRDMFHDRPAATRPVFVQLLNALAARGTMLIGIEENCYPHRWYEEAFDASGFDEGLFEKLYIREHTERFFRDIKESYPGKRILHIGASELLDVIIPRLCGLDSYKMVFFDRASLTAFDMDSQDITREESTDSECSIDEIRQMIDRCDGVTFDVFDTLLMRCTCAPEDVFRLTALEAYHQGLLKDRDEMQRFIAARSEAQTYCSTLAEICKAVSEVMCPGKDAAEVLMQMEIEEERKILVPRRDMADLLEYAVNNDKKVVLVSDMYLPKSVIHSFLEEKGVRGYDDIAVSCECGLSKAEGLFADVKRKCFGSGCRIVHIGDDRVSDGYFAKRAGYTPLIIPAPYADERVRESCDAAGSVIGRLLLGITLAERYSRTGEKGGGRQQALYDYGFCAVAPAIIGWTYWFLREIRKVKPDKVLFAARDGYLFKEVYDLLKTRDDPEAVYYYTSRHAAFLTCSDRKEMIGYVTGMASELSAGEVLSRFYEIDEDQQSSGSTAEELILANMEQICESARKARAGQQAYWEREGLQSGAEYAFFDFLSAGTTQRILEEISSFDIRGYYFGRNDNISLVEKRKTFLSGDSTAEKAFLDRYMEMEYYLMSPEPSLRRYAEDGTPEFSNEIRTKDELEDTAVVHRGVRDFLRQFVQIYPAGQLPLIEVSISAEFICRIYLMNRSDLPKRRYYDDWSNRWLN